jgi:glycosyltransferase involved in cell wall biosynthesis
MKSVLIVARGNAYGLSADTAIMGAALRAVGVSVATATPRGRGFFDRLLRRKTHDVIIHMERAFPAWFSAGRENWLMPNQERFPHRHIARLKRIDRVLAKTRHAKDVFSPLHHDVRQIGFTSPDRRLGGVDRDWNRFFHLAGGSTLKGTEDVLALWAKHPEWPELVLVQKSANAPANLPGNVRLLSGYMETDELQMLQNQCGLHLCPSRSEGWGHHIWEGMSCGAVVVTSDAPPMNEHISVDCGLLVGSSRSEPRHLGANYFVDTSRLEAAIARLIAMPDERKQQLGHAARVRFDQNEADFVARVAELSTLI